MIYRGRIVWQGNAAAFNRRWLFLKLRKVIPEWKRSSKSTS